MLTLDVISDAGTDHVEVADPFLVICGFTGRDAGEVSAHVRELEELGIAAPATTPIFIPAPAHLLRPAGGVVEVASDRTSGEAEPVFVRTVAGDELLTVGSDHTDRELETTSIVAGKIACPKLVSHSAWRLDGVLERWDDLVLTATADSWDEPRRSELAAMMTPGKILAGLDQAVSVPPDRPLVAFMGTLSGAVATEGAAFVAGLRDPATGRTLECGYAVSDVSSLRRAAS